MTPRPPSEPRDPDDSSGEPGGGAGGEGHPRPTTPRPVRAGLSDRVPPEVDAAGVLAREGALRVELGGEAWTVRLRGLAQGRVSQGVVDLMLLGFHRGDEEEPVREALVPGKTLDELGLDDLRAAWERSRPVRDPSESTELFPGTRRKGSRGR